MLSGRNESCASCKMRIRGPIGIPIFWRRSSVRYGSSIIPIFSWSNSGAYFCCSNDFLNYFLPRVELWFVEQHYLVAEFLEKNPEQRWLVTEEAGQLFHATGIRERGNRSLPTGISIDPLTSRSFIANATAVRIATGHPQRMSSQLSNFTPYSFHFLSKNTLYSSATKNMLAHVTYLYHNMLGSHFRWQVSNTAG